MGERRKMKFFIIGIVIVIGIFGMAAFVTAGQYDTADEWFYEDNSRT